MENVVEGKIIEHAQKISPNAPFVTKIIIKPVLLLEKQGIHKHNAFILAKLYYLSYARFDYLVRQSSFKLTKNENY